MPEHRPSQEEQIPLAKIYRKQIKKTNKNPKTKQTSKETNNEKNKVVKEESKTVKGEGDGSRLYSNDNDIDILVKTPRDYH